MTDDEVPSVFTGLRPVRWRPRVLQILGTGFDVIGREKPDSATGAYRALYTLSVLYVPLVHLGAYRVVDTPSGRQWLGREPLSRGARTWNAFVLLVLLSVGVVLGYQQSMRGPTPSAERALVEADRKARSGDILEAARSYSTIARGGTPSSDEARKRFQSLLDSLPGEASFADAARAIELADALDRDGYSLELAPAVAALADRDFLTHPVDVLEQVHSVVAPRSRPAAQDLVERMFRSRASEIAADTVVAAFEAASRMSTRGVEASLLAPAREWLDREGERNPRTALALLDVVLAAAGTNDPLDGADSVLRGELVARRRFLLEEALARDPSDLDYAVRLAQIDAAEGNTQAAVRLLAPHSQKLGSTEGARILGQAYASQGKTEEAVALLRPYVRACYQKLRAFEQDYTATFERKQTAIAEEIRSGAAPDFDYAAYRSAVESEQRKILERYARRRVLSDADLQQLQRRLFAAQDVVPVCLQLGTLLLQKAQGAADAKDRAALLKEAEETLLKVRGSASESTAYRLSLAEVYYWLGRSSEGSALLEQVLSSEFRSAGILMQASSILRRVGDIVAARQLAAEAFEKADSDRARWVIASQLSALADNPSDRIAWLEKADLSDGWTQANLADARGTAALLTGDGTAAAEQFRKAIEFYEGHSDNPGALSNAGRSLAQLFQVTGDRADLQKAVEKFERAFERQPSDPLIGRNLASQLEQLAVYDVMENRIDLAKLQASASLPWLAYLYDDPAGRAALAERLRGHAALNRAVAMSERVMVLAPKSATSYWLAYQVAVFLDDHKRLEELASAVDKIEVALSDTDREWIAFTQGAGWPSVREQTEQFIARMRRVLADHGAEMDPVTRSVAQTQLALALGNVATMGVDVDADEIVRLCREAREASPSVATRGHLVHALLMRADRGVWESREAYRDLTSPCRRSVPPAYRIALALAGPMADGVLANADVQESIGHLSEAFQRYPKLGTPWTWAMLSAARPETANQVRDAILADSMAVLASRIVRKLSPTNVEEVLDLVWLARMTDPPNDASAEIGRLRKLGIPLPTDLGEPTSANE